MSRIAPATPTTEGTTAPAVSLRGITKRFPGVVANDAVDFEAAVGEVHALLGENGAGKSTLSNILTGLYHADEGEIVLYGEPVAFTSPRAAIAAGIGMVHQHFRLVEPFTVAENIVLGDHREAGRIVIDQRAIERRVVELGERYGIAVDPRARIWQLSVGEQQRVEILKALYREARILILDEPTAVLTPQEATQLFVTLRAMAAEGRTVIFISHKLHEVTAVADRVTVLRGGRSIATVSAAGATTRSLAALMVGREIETERRRESTTRSDEMLRVDALCAIGDRGMPALRDVSFVVHAGEVLGVAGVAGNGQRELAEAITGLRPVSSGTIEVGGVPLASGDPRAAIHAGLAHIPEDRLHTAVAPGMTLSDNVSLKDYRNGGSLGPFLRLARMRDRALELISRYDVRTPGPSIPTRQLSGGNLQKVVIGREFSGEPRVLVAAAPTRGLDVGAIETVHGHLRAAAERGMAILLLSEDLDEVLALADRVVVMYEGAIAGERDARTASIEELGLLMAGVTGEAA